MCSLVAPKTDRTAIRDAVFKRDGNLCVFCKQSAKDAHHLLERRLWDDGGYHLDNLISVCYDCHRACEQTLFTVEEGREAAHLPKNIPCHLYDDVIYDKWGNPFVGDIWGCGELFWDESVQKVLEPVMDRYTQRVKYPRTYHLPWSNPGKDDRTLESLDHFYGKDIVVTEKMDGENTTLYCDGLHARSLDSGNHPSRNWVKHWWSRFGYEIPYGMRICGENLYATHSIKYQRLPTYFMGFSVWDKDVCLSWDDTLEWFALLGITPVPTLYEGPFERCDFRGLGYDTNNRNREGYVVRLKEAFTLREFRKKVGKYVRPNHVTASAHWSTHFTINGLEDS